MSDSEDDFVEVGGYQSCDSDWEKISGYSSSEEVPRASNGGGQWSPELVTSYYRTPEEGNKLHLQEQEVPALQLTGNLHDDEPRCTSPPSDGDSEKARPDSRTDSRKVNSQGSKKKHRWAKVSLKRGSGAPYDPVEFLGISGGEKSLLSHFGITTIGQLAYFNATDFISSTEPDKYSIILDLQERAYQAVTEYVTRSSSQPETVWGYLYLGDKELQQILRKGYLDSDSLYFLWTPMPAVLYQNQLAIDNLVGTETNNRELRTRYTRFVKINLTKLCNKHYGRLYQKEPESLAAPNKWIAITLLEAAALSQREDLWFSFEPGNDVFARVSHGNIVIPTGRIPKDCVELDKETCAFSANSEESENSDDEREEIDLTVATKLDYFL